MQPINFDAMSWERRWSKHTKLTPVCSARVRSGGSWPEFVVRDRLVYELDHFCGFSSRETLATGPAITWHAFTVFSFFCDSLLFLKVPRDHNAACKIMCLFVWLSGKLDGFIGIFFFKGLSHPDPVNISMSMVFEVLFKAGNWTLGKSLARVIFFYYNLLQTN